MKLGEMLIRRNIVSQAQVEQAIAIQQTTHQKLGKILVEVTSLDHYELERSLQEQYWRTRQKWVID